MFHWAAGVGWPVGRLVAWLGLHQVHYVISKISSILTGNTKDHFHSFLHFFLDKLHFDADSKAVLEILRAIALLTALLGVFGLNATSPNNSYLPIIFGKFALI